MQKIYTREEIDGGNVEEFNGGQPSIEDGEFVLEFRHGGTELRNSEVTSDGETLVVNLESSGSMVVTCAINDIRVRIPDTVRRILCTLEQTKV